MAAEIALAEIDGIRFSDWINQSGISRSTAFELVKVLGLTLESRKVPGIPRPVVFVDANSLQVLEGYAADLRAGRVTLAALKRDPRYAAAIVPTDPIVPDDPGPSGDDSPLPLLDRLQAVELAIGTGAPLTTMEVKLLLGALPGAAVVRRGRVTATRTGRNQWVLDGPG